MQSTERTYLVDWRDSALIDAAVAQRAECIYIHCETQLGAPKVALRNVSPVGGREVRIEVTLHEGDLMPTTKTARYILGQMGWGIGTGYYGEVTESTTDPTRLIVRASLPD